MRKALSALVLLATWAGWGSEALAVFTIDSMYVVWPVDSAVGIPTDASILVYGNSMDHNLEPAAANSDGDAVEVPADEAVFSVELTNAAGESVVTDTTVQAMPGGYFFLRARPAVALAPNTEYHVLFRTPEPESVDIAQVFQTADAPASGEPAVPAVTYLGLGVFMEEADGSFCWAEDISGNATLALRFGETPEDSLLILRVTESKEGSDTAAGAADVTAGTGQETVFETILTGFMARHGMGGFMYNFKEDQLLLGGFDGWAEFLPSGSGHYCVQAATLDAQGEPGEWSVPSCSSLVGWWNCGDVVLFGDDIPEGTHVPDEETPGDTTDVGGDTSGGGGCAASRPPVADVSLASLAALLLASLVLMRRRRAGKIA